MIANVPNLVIDYGFGLYNQSGNNKTKMKKMAVSDLAIGGVIPAIGIYNF